MSIRNATKILVDGCIGLLGKGAFGRYLQNRMASASMAQTMKVSHGRQEYVLAVPNPICRFRAQSFSSKEPETLEWIDGFPKNSVLWDIGANVGLYSVYAAKARGCKVWAFEPSVFNLECLARNISLNQVVDLICVVPLPLTDIAGPNTLRMSSIEWGGALSTFGVDYGFDGSKLDTVFGFQALGCTMDDARDKLDIPQPDYIKLDVDGIEHLVLKGGPEVLRKVKGILIEVNDSFQEQAHSCRRILQEAGLFLREKRHGAMFEGSSDFGHTFNQIWSR